MVITYWPMALKRSPMAYFGQVFSAI